MPRWIAGGFLCFAVLACGAGGNRRSSTRVLGRALGNERFTTGRLARPTEWRACAATSDTGLAVRRTTCGERLAPGSRAFKSLSAATTEAKQALGSDSSVGGLHGRALLELRWMDQSPAGIDRAVAALERAARAAPESAAVLNDLAVAHLALAERDQQLRPLLTALDLEERALLYDASSLPALFNRALILERLYLDGTSRTAWTRYRALEGDSAWRSEADAHLRELSGENAAVDWASIVAGITPDSMPAFRQAVAARVAALPQGAREFGFTLLADWGRALDSGRVDRAKVLLEVGREIGGALRAAGDDEGLALAVAAIDSCGDDARRRRAAAGHILLKSGIAFQASASYDRAAKALGDAAAALRDAASPMVRWASFYRAAAEVNLGHHATADSILESLRAAATPREPALIGKTVWALGVNRLRRGDYEGATQFYRDALPYIRAAHEHENEGAISYLLAESLNLGGQSAAGSAEALRGLRLLSPFRHSTYFNNHLTTVAQIARQDSLRYAALDVVTEVLDVSRQISQPQTIAWAYRTHARDLLALGRTNAGDSSIAVAGEWAVHVDSGGGRDRVEADIAYVKALRLLDRDPSAAETMLADVARKYRRLHLDLDVPVALYAGARAAGNAGDATAKRQFLRDAIDQIERQNALFTTSEARAVFHETVENVFDAMIEQELARGDAMSALDYLERARIATWSGSAKSVGTALVRMDAPGLRATAAALPAGTLVIEYAVLADSLVVWSASRGGWIQRTFPVSRDSIAALTRRLAVEARDDRVGASSASARLFDAVLRPVLDKTPGANRLIVIPDRELNHVPFAALWDGATKRFVLEDHQISTVPSVSYLRAASAMAKRGTSEKRVLVVGDPQLDSADRARLPQLPGAAREASRVASLYTKDATELEGAQATRDSLLSLLPHYSVLHFAGHAVTDEDEPQLSYLALASGRAEASGQLRAPEIAKLSLSNVELVLLSACSSLTPRSSRTGTHAGLAYSFLRAGVPATVSTVWDVDDHSAIDMLVEFHQQFKRGVSAADALRNAQLAALRSPDHPEMHSPRVWASFIYTGR